MVEPAVECSHFDTEQSEKVCSEKVCSENVSDSMKEQRMVFNLEFSNFDLFQLMKEITRKYGGPNGSSSMTKKETKKLLRRAYICLHSLMEDHDDEVTRLS